MTRAPKRFILINRVLSGTYLKTELGHEMINFFSDDHGRNFCFVNKDGTMPFSRYNKVDWILNVILVRRGVFAVINALDVQGGHIEFSAQNGQGERVFYLENQSRWLNAQDVRYGGARITDIYHDGAIVTYKCSRTFVPAKRIILADHELPGDPLEGDATILKMKKESQEGGEKQLGNQSPRTYVANTDESYPVLFDMLNNPTYFKRAYFPFVDDVLAGVAMTKIEKEEAIVDLTAYRTEQEKFFCAIAEKKSH